MLKELRLKNFVLVDDLMINFHDNLTVLTGETGAGKSVIVGALYLVLGEHVKNDIFFDKTQKVILEATFNIENEASENKLQELINQYDIEITDNELFFCREIKPDGKSSIFINGRKSTNSIVKEFRNELLDFHSQRDQQELFNEEVQLLFLDKFAELNDLKKTFLDTFNNWIINNKKYKKYLEDVKKNEEKILLYKYQINEIESTHLKPAEEEELDKEHHLLINAKEILDLFINMRTDFFDSEKTIYDICAFYKNKFEGFAQDNKLIFDTVSNLTSCLTALEDISNSTRFFDEEITVDELKLEKIEKRIRELYDIKNKYKMNIKELITYKTEMKSFIMSYKKDIESGEKLKSEVLFLQKQAFEYATQLNDIRIKSAKDFEQQIMKSLKLLAIPDANIKIKVDRINQDKNNHLPEIKDYYYSGFNNVKFLFTANKGTPLQDLKSTISGGELSRLLLVVKTILAKKISKRTVVFDEIDSGIGGGTANMLAKFIKDLSTTHQILCISHLPQVAANAQHHLKIEKILKNDKNQIIVNELEAEDKKIEIARMLSGNITETAIEHAIELLNN